MAFKDIIQTSGKTHKFSSPSRCGNCGYKGNFTLLEFKQMEVEVFDGNEMASIVIPKDVYKNVNKDIMDKVKKYYGEKENEN